MSSPPWRPSSSFLILTRALTLISHRAFSPERDRRTRRTPGDVLSQLFPGNSDEIRFPWTMSLVLRSINPGITVIPGINKKNTGVETMDQKKQKTYWLSPFPRATTLSLSNIGGAAWPTCFPSETPFLPRDNVPPRKHRKQSSFINSYPLCTCWVGTIPFASNISFP